MSALFLISSRPGLFPLFCAANSFSHVFNSARNVCVRSSDIIRKGRFAYSLRCHKLSDDWRSRLGRVLSVSPRLSHDAANFGGSIRPLLFLRHNNNNELSGFHYASPCSNSSCSNSSSSLDTTGSCLIVCMINHVARGNQWRNPDRSLLNIVRASIPTACVSGNASFRCPSYIGIDRHLALPNFYPYTAFIFNTISLI